MRFGITRPAKAEPEAPPAESTRTFSLVERVAVVLLMVMVLGVAGVLSAMTAMRFAIQGRDVAVPDLAGMTEVEASRVLFDAGLLLEVDSSRFSDTVTEGRILDQTPTAGVSVKRPRAVRVLVSLGDRPVSIPNVEGNSLRSAQMQFGQRGLSVGNTLYAHTDVGEPSTVIYQSPPPGEMRGFDPSVSVMVSLGPLDEYFVMPDLTGQTVSTARQRIQAGGFRPPEVVPAVPGARSGGRVISQQPAAGYRVSMNDIIRLEVSE